MFIGTYSSFFCDKPEIFRIIEDSNSLDLCLLFYQFSHFLVICSFFKIFCRFQVDCTWNVRRRQHADDYVQNFPYFLVRHPLLFSQHLLTYFSVSDVWMINWCFELEMGKRKWKSLWKINVQNEFSLLKRWIWWTLDCHLPMEQTLLGFCLNPSKINIEVLISHFIDLFQLFF